MRPTVDDRAKRIATFRFVEVRLMEIVAAWTPTTPEMEVKVLFGRHIWDFAQHADALGKRTFELRRPMQHSERPIAPYVSLLEDTARLERTADRLAALYDAILRGLEPRYARYLQQTDPLLDEPSVVIVERIATDFRRQRHDADRLREELGVGTSDVSDLQRREAAFEDIVAAQGVPT